MSPSDAALHDDVDTRDYGADLAMITALYLASYNIGSALGNTISGAIWTQELPGKLAKHFTNSSAATLAYASPFTFIVEYPWGTPERDQIVAAYRETQRLLTITGICLSVLILACVLIVRNPKLGKEQSLEDAEADAVVSHEKSKVMPVV